MSAARASTALSQCFNADLGQSRGNKVAWHRSNVSCTQVRIQMRMHWDSRHHLSTRGMIQDAFQQAGRPKSFIYAPCRLQAQRSVEGLRRVSWPAVCAVYPCGRLLKSFACQDATPSARRLHGARPSSQFDFAQSIPPTREVAEGAWKVTCSRSHRGVPATVDQSRRGTTSPKSLCKDNSADFGRATTCRTRVFGPKAIGKVGSARLLASRDSAGDGGVAASRVTVEEASMESEWLKVKLKQWLDDEYCPEPANEDISERCKRVYYRCLLEGVNDAGDILVEFIRDLETFSFKESFHGPFTAANAAIALIMERIDTQDS